MALTQLSTGAAQSGAYPLQLLNTYSYRTGPQFVLSLELL